MALALGTNSGFVTVAPTADPAETGTTIDGSSVVTKHTSPAGAVRITSIGWYRASGTNGANWEIALYSDVAGVASARLFVDATNSSTSGGWLVTAVDWAISPSTPYWLALQMDAHSGSSSVDGATSGGAGTDVLTSQTTLNDPYGGGAVADADGMYAIYALVSVSHDATGAISGPGAVIAGSAQRTSPVVSHDTTGALEGPGAVVAGDARRTLEHATTGVLEGPGAALDGAARRTLEHATTGALEGPGASVSGSAERTAATVSHDTTGELVGGDAVVAGSANLEAASVGHKLVAGAGHINIHTRDRFRRNLAKVRREEKKLERLAEKLEKKIVAEKRQGKPVEGILSKYWDLNQKIEANKEEIFRLEVSYQDLTFNEDEDDEEVLLLS